MEFNFKKIIVHSGKFHSDDVMCVAIATLLNPNITVERTFKISEELANDPSVIICDIGGGKYDHHQEDAALREDGKKFAACGLLYRDFGRDLFPNEDSYISFRNRYIIPIENTDNGYDINPLSSAIGAFNSAWNDDCSNNNDAFNNAVHFAQSFIVEEIRMAMANAEAISEADKAEAEAVNGIAITERYIPTQLYTDRNVVLVISPSLRGGWQLLTVKKDHSSLEDKLQLPEEWLHNKPAGCTFIHQARFIATFETKETAVNAAMSLI